MIFERFLNVVMVLPDLFRGKEVRRNSV